MTRAEEAAIYAKAYSEYVCAGIARKFDLEIGWMELKKDAIEHAERTLAIAQELCGK